MLAVPASQCQSQTRAEHSAPSLDHPSEARVWIFCLIHSEAEPSPRLLAALAEVAAALARLAAALDAVAFRAAWRGLATSANRLLYNDVATEARFSPYVRNALRQSAS